MSREKKNPDAQWFIEPLDAGSNERIMNLLNQDGSGSAEIENVRIADNDGNLHRVLEVSYSDMLRIVRSGKNTPQLKFKTWNRTRPRATLRDCSILFRHKGAEQSAEVQRVKRELAKRKKPPISTDFEPF